LDLGVSDDAGYDGYVKSKNKNLTSASISGMILNNLMDPLLNNSRYLWIKNMIRKMEFPSIVIYRAL
jgi:hypothetical protein